MPKIGGQKDPHMKSPVFKYIIIIALIALILIFVVPKVIDIYNDNLNDVNERADK